MTVEPISRNQKNKYGCFLIVLFMVHYTKKVLHVQEVWIHSIEQLTE